jgi:hypothetical protein
MKIEQKKEVVWPQEQRKTRRKDPSRAKEVCGRKGRPAKESIKFLFLSAAHTLRVKTAYKIEDGGNNGTVKVCSTAAAAMEKK